MEVWWRFGSSPRKLLFTVPTCASIRGARGPSTGVNNHRRPDSMIKVRFLSTSVLYTSHKFINVFINNVSYNNLHVSLVYRASLGALCVLPLLAIFLLGLSQTPFYSHRGVVVRRSDMYRTCIAFGIVASLASMYWAWYRRARYIMIRAKGQSAKKGKVFLK